MHPKLYKKGLVIGRFQTFHLQHEKLIKESIKRCDKTLVLVGSAQEFGTLRNPLDSETRINLIRKTFPQLSDTELLIKGINDLKNELNNDFSWGEFVKSETKKHFGDDQFADLIIYGNDPVKRTWFNPDDIPYTYELFIPRTEISATYVRGLMVIDNKSAWAKLTPEPIHNMYTEIREKIMSIPIYQEIYAHIKSEPSLENFFAEYRKFEKEDQEKKLKDLQTQ